MRATPLTTDRLTTERLTLRPLRLCDAPRIAAFTQDWDVARMLSHMPYPQIGNAAEGFVLLTLARAPLGREHNFGIDLEGEGLIGLVGAHKRPDGGFELGYWIGKPYWNQGFATEAARAATRFVADLQEGRVRAGHYLDNPASGRVLEKAGFEPTGEIEQRFSLARATRAPLRVMEFAEAA